MSSAIKIGNRFGQLTVLSLYRNGKRLVAVCKCDCGAIRHTRVDRLLSKRFPTRSCGCQNAEFHKTHGGTGTRLFRIYRNMKNRCFNKKVKSYRYYGGKGIKVCEDWAASFASFREWALASGYRDDLTLDRIDVDGDYSPANCRWATNAMQANNKTTTFKAMLNGEMKTLSELSAISGLDRRLISQRIRNGKTVEQAISVPPREATKYPFRGGMYTLNKISKTAGIPFSTLQHRVIKMGMSPEEATSTRPTKK